MITANHRVAIVGKSGVVGQVLSELLEERGVAHVWSIGRDQLRHDPDDSIAGESVFARFDVVFFCTPADVSRQHVPDAAKVGCVVVDNSSAFRMDNGIPLVIPEVNAHHVFASTSVIANPNCSTILLLVPLSPLDHHLEVERIIVSTYQAVSGAGRKAMEELESSTRAHLDNRPYSASVFRETPAFNVFSHDSSTDIESGCNQEEIKIASETQKILGRKIPVVATCVRVPALRSHCESVVVEVARPATISEVRKILSHAKGVDLVDDRAVNEFPTALKATGSKEIMVGRIRADTSRPSVGRNESGEQLFTSFALFLAGDQLLKGAAGMHSRSPTLPSPEGFKTSDSATEGR